MTKRDNRVSEPQRTNDTIIKEIKELLNELKLVDGENLTIDSYAFTIHDSEVEVFKQAVPVEEYLLNNVHKMKWVPKLEHVERE